MEYSIKNAIGGKQNFSLVELQEKTGMGLSDLLSCVEQMVLNGEATLSVSINAESCYVHKSRYECLYAGFMDLVSVHFTDSRNVDFYASRLCISRNHLYSVVKQICGKTPAVLIKEKVIGEIKYRLCCTQESIKEIAYGLNFPNLSFFGRYFKGETGVSPSAYRAIHSKMRNER